MADSVGNDQGGNSLTANLATKSIKLQGVNTILVLALFGMMALMGWFLYTVVNDMQQSAHHHLAEAAAQHHALQMGIDAGIYAQLLSPGERRKLLERMQVPEGLEKIIQRNGKN